jgi:hypothetical protein
LAGKRSVGRNIWRHEQHSCPNRQAVFGKKYIYSNTNPNLIRFSALILRTTVHQYFFQCVSKLMLLVLTPPPLKKLFDTVFLIHRKYLWYSCAYQTII